MGRLKVASLFCGCGGMDLGILGGFDFLDTNYPRSAFDIVYAVDNDPYCTKIYNANFEHKCQIKDVRDISPDEMPDFDFKRYRLARIRTEFVWQSLICCLLVSLANHFQYQHKILLA